MFLGLLFEICMTSGQATQLAAALPDERADYDNKHLKMTSPVAAQMFLA